MADFQVDSETVLATTATARASAARIRAEVASLGEQLSSLQSSWRGQAASAFLGVLADWRATQQRVDDSLDSINLALGHAGQQYADVEQANARMFAG